MRRKECSKIYWKFLLCVYIFVLPCVWIRGVWEKTLILRTFCIWPWRCLSLSLSEAAFFDGTGPTDPIYDFFKSPIWNTTTSISIQFLPTLKKIYQRVCLTERLHLHLSWISMLFGTLYMNSSFRNLNNMKIVFSKMSFKYVGFSVMLHTESSSTKPKWAQTQCTQKTEKQAENRCIKLTWIVTITWKLKQTLAYLSSLKHLQKEKTEWTRQLKWQTHVI